jgi:hypothetical protein
MAEAMRSIQDTTSQAQRAAIATLARQRAIKAVKQQLHNDAHREKHRRSDKPDRCP